MEALPRGCDGAADDDADADDSHHPLGWAGMASFTGHQTVMPLCGVVVVYAR